MEAVGSSEPFVITYNCTLRYKQENHNRHQTWHSFEHQTVVLLFVASCTPSGFSRRWKSITRAHGVTTQDTTIWIITSNFPQFSPYSVHNGWKLGHHRTWNTRIKLHFRTELHSRQTQVAVMSATAGAVTFLYSSALAAISRRPAPRHVIRSPG